MSLDLRTERLSTPLICCMIVDSGRIEVVDDAGWNLWPAEQRRLRGGIAGELLLRDLSSSLSAEGWIPSRVAMRIVGYRTVWQLPALPPRSGSSMRARWPRSADVRRIIRHGTRIHPLHRLIRGRTAPKMRSSTLTARSSPARTPAPCAGIRRCRRRAMCDSRSRPEVFSTHDPRASRHRAPPSRNPPVASFVLMCQHRPLPARRPSAGEWRLSMPSFRECLSVLCPPMS